MKALLKPIVAVALAFSMLLTTIPVSALQTGLPPDNNSLNTGIETDVGQVGNDAEPSVLYEIEEKRTEYTKHFRMSDGTVKACTYPVAVHFADAVDGTMQEIDNRLEKMTAADGKTYYTNSENSINVSLPENFFGGKVQYSDDNGFVSFRLIGGLASTLKKRFMGFGSGSDTAAKHIAAAATYKSVADETDIEYELYGSTLKETIVLNDYTDRSFSFDVETDAAYVIKSDDGSLSFYGSDGNCIYVMDAPFMFDDNGEYSHDIDVTLVRLAGGRYIVKYTPDRTWLSDASREYPVKIDPTIRRFTKPSDIADTYVYSVQGANEKRGGTDIINVGKQVVGGTSFLVRSLIRFGLPSEIKDTDCIVDARLNLVHNPGNYYYSKTTNGLQVDLHELAYPFDEANTVWDNRPDFYETAVDYAFVNKSNMLGSTGLSYDSFNITKLVGKWQNGAPNYGVILKMHDEGAAVSSSRQVFYISKDSVYFKDVTQFLEITYRDTTGLEDYWSYTDQSLGGAGNGYVNNYNGNLVYTYTTAANNTANTAFTLTHIYNSALDNGVYGCYGSGWRLNLQQTLIPVTIDGNSSVKFLYTDGDGTGHYLVETGDGKTVDEDGLGLTLEPVTGVEYRNYRLVDKSGTKLVFDTNHNLSEIYDANGNLIDILFSRKEGLEDYYITGVTTSSGENFTLSYDSNYRLSYIEDNAGRKTYMSGSGTNLGSVTNPDGTVTGFEYYPDRKLKAVTAPSGHKLQYTYSSGRVSKAEAFGKNGSSAGWTAFDYSINQTVVTNSDGDRYTYQFDTIGRAVSVYDKYNNICTKEFTGTSNAADSIRKNNKTSTVSGTETYVDNLLPNGMFYKGFDSWEKFSSPSLYEITNVYQLVSSKTMKITGVSDDYAVIKYPYPSLEPGTYTLSGYVKTENVSGGAGALLEVVTSAKGSLTSEHLYGTTDGEVNSGFKRLSVTFTLENGESVDRITAGLYLSTGTVYLNGLQLEKGDSANNANLISNSSFERVGSNGLPEGFSGTTDTSAVVSYGSHDGNRALKIDGKADGEYHIRQSVMQDGKAGDVFTFGGWAKASSVKREGANVFGMTLMIFYTDGTTGWETLEFNRDVDGYQCSSKVFVLKKDCNEFVVHMCYFINLNSVYYDSMFLYKDTAQSYIYDSDGNVVSTADNARKESNFEYSDNSLSKLITPIGQKYTYNYDSNKNTVYAYQSSGIGYSAVYDSYGNAVSGTTIADRTGSPLVSGKYYYIKHKMSGKYLYATNPSANYSDVVLRSGTGDARQKFLAIKTPDGYYAFKSAADLDGGLNYYSRNEPNTKVETDIIGKNSTNADYNHWKLVDTGDGDGAFNLIARPHAYGGCMSVNNDSSEENTGLYLTYANGSEYQKWYFVEVPDDGSMNGQTVVPLATGKQYYIRNLESGQFAGISGAPQYGSSIVQNNLNAPNTYCQKWNVARQANGTWILQPVGYDDFYLSLQSELEQYSLVEIKQGDYCIQWAYWSIEPCNDFTGTYRMRALSSLGSDKYAAIDDGQKSEGARVYLTDKADKASQKWCLIEVGKEMRSSAEYSENGAYLTKLTDGRGNSTEYTYDTSKGLLSSVTDASGNTTSYTYDASTDRMLSVTSGNSTVFYSYDTYGTLQNITSAGGTVYSFTYDQFGRTTDVKVGSRTLSSTDYLNDHSSLVSSLTYGNGSVKRYFYDDQQRIKEISVDNAVTARYNYNRLGNLVKYTDLKTGISWDHEYDLIGRTVRSDANDGRYIGYSYDSFNRLYSVKEKIAGIEFKTVYNYDDQCNYSEKSGLVMGLSYGGVEQFVYSYDGLNRLASRTLLKNTGFKTSYSYLDGAADGTTTSLVKSVDNNGELLEYSYDQNGNITSISKNGTVVESYTYDALGQLISVTRGSDVYGYSYDAAGNILSVTKNGTAFKSYGYTDSEWKDLLTSFNGEAITYDAIGNPLHYRDGISMTWESGRQLSTLSKSGLSAGFAYSADGYRTEKTVNGITTRYYYVGDRLQYQQTGNDILVFVYDDKGTPFGLFTVIDGVAKYYFYVYNAQGDVIALIDDYAERVVNYEYGAWGETISITGAEASGIGVINPLRYRGYYYDTETGLYYVSSRYYDPEIGRYLNADNVIAGVGGSVQGYNLFAYCFNNPVNMSDSSGHWPQWIKDAASWVNNNIVQPVANFFSPKTNTISGRFQDGIFRGSGSLTGGYSEFNGRLQVNSKDHKNNGMLGGYGKVSVGNASGKIGIGNDNVASSLKGVGDALTTTAQVGIQYKNGAGLAAKAKAAVLSGRATSELELFGWQIEFGVSGDLLSVGAEAMIGVFPDEGFTAKASVGAGLFGGGFVFRIKPKQ